MRKKIRLGINIDHVATIRNARNEGFPHLIDIVKILKKLKVDSVTVHLREDRRHIKDKDVVEIKKKNILPLNLEMAATKEMKAICLKNKPFACCIVPERRKELTTEGGLDVKNQKKYLTNFLPEILKSGIRTSLFVDPDIEQIKVAKELGVNAVELHTGKYSKLFKEGRFKVELKKIMSAAKICFELGLECHAGHGLNFSNVRNISSIPEISELNIGHFLVANSIIFGLEKTLKRLMKIVHYSGN